ncbi:MAG: metal-sensitive transcriptional regulator [Sphingobacteriia bacterium]|nr:metal-sensitive transcriptional regulator [Sphingobacteriia bacterium]
MNDIVSHHPSHKDELLRINKIKGQIEGIKKMIEEGRYCPDIIIQLKAVRSAIKNVELNILEKHLDNCLVKAFDSKNYEDDKRKISEIKDLIKRFEDK